jgi:hypothetical protein
MNTLVFYDARHAQWQRAETTRNGGVDTKGHHPTVCGVDAIIAIMKPD